jgi:tetratricopeptide (TPR) repeat protein
MTAETTESLCQRARQAIAQGQIDQARKLYMQALAVRADAPDVHYGLATACFLLNDLDSAAYHFKEVTRLDPLRPGAYINLGAVYNRLGEFDEAVQTLRRGIRIDPHRAEGYYNLGLVYRNMGQAPLAVQAYLEATRLDPRMVDAHYNLGNLYFETGRYQLAITHYKTVLQLRPNWDKALKALAQTEAAHGVSTSEPAPAAGETAVTPLPTEQSLSSPDLNRNVDAAVHGEILSVLHHATIDSESHGRQFLQVLEQQVEPAIKELANRLVGTATAKADLGPCVKKFETAIATMRTAQRELETCIQRVRNLGTRLLESD